ncbi:carboxymuconolactone decarboxylase family protein [Chitinophaga qingshengii]|uniref:Carboxymuconolactone decarboxylase family protein n=1 Tax=Chitinophaga qingshengii TaxID=1569794 RepID=A0ABR7TK83_9BACT|nr:carboxymuconolactone decarboxylase family protein [Chitinophaga qingshengii]MBC9929938.1 carboxymuconolactone decarboxylase family protein [Chitinophaga qingshengii]
MKERFFMQEVQPEAFKTMVAMDKYTTTTNISPLHREMIKVRASQLNGCAYCLDKHAADARKLGETEQRLLLLSAWRESPQFTEEERIILAMTEEVTFISQQGLTAGTYNKALACFGLETTAQLLMHIICINAWNRIGIATHRIPGQHHPTPVE